jgi:hypothetical protein
MAFRTPTRGPARTGPTLSGAHRTSTRSPSTASAPSSAIVIPRNRQRRPGPEALAGSAPSAAPARRRTASPRRATRFAQTTWWIRYT